MQRFLQELKAANISYQLLADVVEVTDLRWLEAVEGALGMERFTVIAVSYTHLRAHETVLDLVCRLLLEKKKEMKKEKIPPHPHVQYYYIAL